MPGSAGGQWSDPPRLMSAATPPSRLIPLFVHAPFSGVYVRTSPVHDHEIAADDRFFVKAA